MSHMRAIFSSHEALFDQFCGFLPGQETTLEPPACSTPSAYCPSALDFVSYVKARCAATTPDVYHQFLALLAAVDRGHLAVPEVRPAQLRLDVYTHDEPMYSPCVCRCTPKYARSSRQTPSCSMNSNASSKANGQQANLQ